MKLIHAISIVAILGLGASGFLLYKYMNSQKQLTQLTTKSVDQTPKVVEQVGKLMQLPNNETPTVATITDREKLKAEAFYSLTENGDQILIYLQAKKAILYRPSINKIIDIIPINSGSPSAQIKPKP